MKSSRNLCKMGIIKFTKRYKDLYMGLFADKKRSVWNYLSILKQNESWLHFPDVLSLDLRINNHSKVFNISY